MPHFIFKIAPHNSSCNMEGIRVGQALPNKENNLYKQMLRQYDSKQFSKALKTANKILERVPDHDETLSMKGLILYFMGSREEGLAAAKKGLMKGMKTAMCWHSLGILHKADKNYSDASKCFEQASKLDVDNLTIQRDLSLLYLQLRDYENYRNIRLHLLTNRPNVDIN